VKCQLPGSETGILEYSLLLALTLAFEKLIWTWYSG